MIGGLAGYGRTSYWECEQTLEEQAKVCQDYAALYYPEIPWVGFLADSEEHASTPILDRPMGRLVVLWNAQDLLLLIPKLSLAFPSVESMVIAHTVWSVQRIGFHVLGLPESLPRPNGDILCQYLPLAATAYDDWLQTGQAEIRSKERIYAKPPLPQKLGVGWQYKGTRIAKSQRERRFARQIHEAHEAGESWEKIGHQFWPKDPHAAAQAERFAYAFMNRFRNVYD